MQTYIASGGRRWYNEALIAEAQAIYLTLKQLNAPPYVQCSAREAFDSHATEHGNQQCGSSDDAPVEWDTIVYDANVMVMSIYFIFIMNVGFVWSTAASWLPW